MKDVDKIINDKNKKISDLVCQINELTIENMKLKSVILQLQYDKGNLLKNIGKLKEENTKLLLDNIKQ